MSLSNTDCQSGTQYCGALWKGVIALTAGSGGGMMMTLGREVTLF